MGPPERPRRRAAGREESPPSRWSSGALSAGSPPRSGVGGGMLGPERSRARGAGGIWDVPRRTGDTRFDMRQRDHDVEGVRFYVTFYVLGPRSTGTCTPTLSFWFFLSEGVLKKIHICKGTEFN
jgi:hypothetical protein